MYTNIAACHSFEREMELAVTHVDISQIIPTVLSNELFILL